MNCMKCGRDIEEDQVFCDRCLQDMLRYPVKPNTVIQLPLREAGAAPKKAPQKRRQDPSAEERLQTAKRFIKRILILWLITLALLIASLFPAVRFLMGESFRLPGQNYSTFSTTPTQPSVSAEATTAPTTP